MNWTAMQHHIRQAAQAFAGLWSTPLGTIEAAGFHAGGRLPVADTPSEEQARQAVDSGETGRQAQIDAGDECALHAAGPYIVWHGEWLPDDNGIFEARPCVCSTEDGYQPGLQVSRLGCEPVHQFARDLSRFDTARRSAHAMVSAWLQHGDSLLEETAAISGMHHG